MRRIVALLLALGAALTLTSVAGARVLRVGTYHGIRGQYKTIQAAVRAAHPGDWILLAPGDYKTRLRAITAPKGHKNFPAAVLITKSAPAHPGHEPQLRGHRRDQAGLGSLQPIG